MVTLCIVRVQACVQKCMLNSGGCVALGLVSPVIIWWPALGDHWACTHFKMPATLARL